MKRILAFLLAAVMLAALAACGGRQAEGTGAAEEAAADLPSVPKAESAEGSAIRPSGLFMLRHIGDENGAYVPESNEFEDFFNRPTTLHAMMYAENDTIWCEIGEDGVGQFHAPGRDSKPIDFNTGEEGVVRLGMNLCAYRYDEITGVFWVEEEPESPFWDVMEPCSREKLDLVFEGKGGSVPLAEGEIGDLVCMGQYVQDENQEVRSPIYWRVLDKRDGRLLLLSEKLLDSFSFNYNPDHAVLTDVTWENCSLREFLNLPEGFLSMFTDEELARMQMTHLENRAANEELMAQWGTFEDQGDAHYSELAVQDRADDPDTDDTVFLLSYQEVLHYLGEPNEDYTDNDYPFTEMKVNPDWIAAVTDAVRTGYYDSVTGAGAWMTRTLCSSHSDEDMVVYISGSGQVFDYYTYVPLFIRPAVWVSAEG